MVILDADGSASPSSTSARPGRPGRAPRDLPAGHRPGTRAPEPGRLDAVTATTDGFGFPRRTSSCRAKGDILGASRSSSQSTLKLLRVLEHEDIIARGHGRTPRERGERGTRPWHGIHRLADAINEYLNPEKEAFLERGSVGGHEPHHCGRRRRRDPAGQRSLFALARPATDRVKEALFSRLDAFGIIAGARVLDLYASSGALGVESGSRGRRRR